jgi:outer membrane lipoprotein-sorting protein
MYTLRSQQKKKAEKKSANIASYITTKEKQIATDSEIPENKIYFIHKTPRSLKFLQKTQDIRQIVYDLKFLEIYDKSLYEKILSYVEYFLKIHYKVMIGKYEFDYYFPILKDVRNEVLNTMKTIYFNIPKKTRILDIEDMDSFVDERIALMQAKTYKYMKVLFHKYQRNHVFYQAPFEHDRMKDKYYHVF